MRWRKPEPFKPYNKLNPEKNQLSMSNWNWLYADTAIIRSRTSSTIKTNLYWNTFENMKLSQIASHIYFAISNCLMNAIWLNFVGFGRCFVCAFFISQFARRYFSIFQKYCFQSAPYIMCVCKISFDSIA